MGATAVTVSEQFVIAFSPQTQNVSESAVAASMLLERSCYSCSSQSLVKEALLVESRVL